MGNAGSGGAALVSAPGSGISSWHYLASTSDHLGVSALATGATTPAAAAAPTTTKTSTAVNLQYLTTSP